MHIETIRPVDPGTGTPREIAFRPFTGGGADLRAATDPINLVFVGEPDALGIRAALRSLPRGRSDRWSALVDSGATWTDAVGGAQTAFAPESGWSAGAVQLELGEFSGRRAHLRLFPFPGFVLGAAHLEQLPTGSFEHSVFSWSGAEQLVVRELERAGVVATRTSHEMRLETPRRIEDPVPGELLAVAGFRRGTPDPGDPIPGWGSLTVVSLENLPRGDTPRHLRWSHLTLDTRVTLPGIAAQTDIRVQGPIDIEHEVWSELGRLRARTRVMGDLVLDIGGRDTPAQVNEWQVARVSGGVGRIRSARRYLTGLGLPGSEPALPEVKRHHTVQTRIDRKSGPQISVSAE